MSGQFPTSDRNALLLRISQDPRSQKTLQLRPTPPTSPPIRVRRAAARGITWGLSRSMAGYEARQDKQIGGHAPKWVLQGTGGRDDFYIVKLGAKNGHVEVLTELFNNELGSQLGFQMAHCGLARLDEHLYFVTRNFRNGEMLVHASLLIAEALNEREEALEGIDRTVEQEFYEVAFIREAITQYAGFHADSIFQQFIDMLTFDTLIGSADRHAKNWGVLKPERDDLGTVALRLAPLFDSARALLWDCPEAKLVKLDQDERALQRYVHGAQPCIGPARPHHKSNGCNHFELFANLCERYPHQTLKAYAHLADKDVAGTARALLRRFPYQRGFSSLRKRVIVKVLELRSQLLGQVARERGKSDDVHIAVAFQHASSPSRGAL